MKRAELAEWLTGSADILPGSVDVSSDRARSLTSRLVRATWKGERLVAVGSDVDTKTQIGAAIDAIGWHIFEGDDHKAVTVVYAGDATGEAAQALRTLRSQVRSPTLRLLTATRNAMGEVVVEEDTAEPPDFAKSLDAARWAGLMDGWDEAQPPTLAHALAREVADDVLRLYPMLSQSPNPPRWSIRIDGLEIGRLQGDKGTLDVGRPGKTGNLSLARTAWVSVAGTEPVIFGTNAADVTVSVESAGRVVRELIAAFRQGSPSGILRHGQPEHALESRILRGDTTVECSGNVLRPLLADSLVARGSQFPTKWSLTGGRPRYLDGLLIYGRTPWAVEMKVQAGGGFGAYYRHAVGQAVLYRHFIRTAAAVHPWFERKGMDPTACRAAVVFPLTPPVVKEKMARLGELAARFDVEVSEVDLPMSARAVG